VSAIIPRWEWRAFGDTVGDVRPRLGDDPPERVHESDETYLLSMDGTDAVKVRDELMDVKHLVHVDDDGLEQWIPVMKAGFPLSAADVGAVLTALRVDAPSRLPRATYTFRELLADLVDPNPDLLAVEVHKRRERYTIGGCMAELTDVRTTTASTRTFAIESEDAARVLAAVRDLGLAPRPNVSFARGLKALVGIRRERYAVIDVGTNSVKFHIGERRTDGYWHTVVDRAEITRLGDGLHETGRLHPEPMERTIDAIAGMVEEAGREQVSAIAAAGTAGLRIAGNSADFVRAVQVRCGVVVQVISGEDEARLAYLAAVAGLGHAPGPSVVFDTGGGSSQFTFGQGADVVERFSVDVGAVRFTERYALDGAVSRDVLAQALGAISADLDRLDGRPAPASLAGMGGAVTNLAAVSHGLAEYDPEIVQGTVLDRTELDRQIELYRTRTADERRTIVGLQPQRADIILAGACIVHTVLDKLGRDSLTVSDRGLRHGLLAERFGRSSSTAGSTG
jgi:exopolyphosphatase/guanosine-5'-triphosphate,3'-diphosphate pyrophosphatase